MEIPFSGYFFGVNYTGKLGMTLTRKEEFENCNTIIIYIFEK